MLVLLPACVKLGHSEQESDTVLRFEPALALLLLKRIRLRHRF